MKNKQLIIYTILLFCFCFVAKAQELPLGYGGVTIGMSVEEVKQALINNPDFGYRGDRDVSLLPGENRVLIETDTEKTNPYSFLKRSYFQFYKDKLYIITVNINTQKTDYNSVFTTLCNKYGNPSSLNPQKCEWSNDDVIVNLEKPLTLKYTDKKIFDELLNDYQLEKSSIEQAQERFLDGL